MLAQRRQGLTFTKLDVYGEESDSSAASVAAAVQQQQQVLQQRNGVAAPSSSSSSSSSRRRRGNRGETAVILSAKRIMRGVKKRLHPRHGSPHPTAQVAAQQQQQRQSASETPPTIAPLAVEVHTKPRSAFSRSALPTLAEGAAEEECLPTFPTGALSILSSTRECPTSDISQSAFETSSGEGGYSSSNAYSTSNPPTDISWDDYESAKEDPPVGGGKDPPPTLTLKSRSMLSDSKTDREEDESRVLQEKHSVGSTDLMLQLRFPTRDAGEEASAAEVVFLRSNDGIETIPSQDALPDEKNHPGEKEGPEEKALSEEKEQRDQSDERARAAPDEGDEIDKILAETERRQENHDYRYLHASETDLQLMTFLSEEEMFIVDQINREIEATKKRLHHAASDDDRGQELVFTMSTFTAVESSAFAEASAETSAFTRESSALGNARASPIAEEGVLYDDQSAFETIPSSRQEEDDTKSSQTTPPPGFGRRRSAAVAARAASQNSPYAFSMPHPKSKYGKTILDSWFVGCLMMEMDEQYVIDGILSYRDSQDNEDEWTQPTTYSTGSSHTSDEFSARGGRRRLLKAS